MQGLVNNVAATDSFVWAEFLDTLTGASLVTNVTDSYAWLKETDGSFSVHSCFNMFSKENSASLLSAEVVKAAKFIWEISVPSNLSLFGWRFIFNRLPTKDQLFVRGILTNPRDLYCVFCDGEEEMIAHLFGVCSFSARIWEKVKVWLGSLIELSLEEFSNFFFYYEKGKGKLKRIIIAVVWLATAWTL